MFSAVADLPPRCVHAKDMGLTAPPQLVEQPEVTAPTGRPKEEEWEEQDRVC